MDDGQRESYENRFKTLQNPKKLGNGSSTSPDEDADVDVEMGDSGREETPNGNGGGFRSINRD